MHTSAVLNAEESLKGQPLAPSFFLLLPLFSFGSVILSFPPFFFSPMFQIHTDRKTIRHTRCQTDSTVFTLFICHINETASRKALSISSRRWRSRRSHFKVLHPFKALSKCLQTAKCVCAWQPARVQAGSPASPHRSVCTTQKLDVNRCCFVFMGRLSYKSPLQKLSPRSLLSLRLFVVYPGFFFFHFLYHGKDSAFHFIMCEEFVFMHTLALCWKDLHATNWLGWCMLYRELSSARWSILLSFCSDFYGCNSHSSLPHRELLLGKTL